MDSRQLRYFTAIHEEGSLARAAEREHVAISALSRHLANLEAELGTQLCIREPRGMRPTAAGLRLYEHARNILRAMSAAETDLRDEGREVAGDVAIGMAYSAVKAIGVTLMQRVLADYPLVRLSLSESLSGSTLLHLLASEVDLALVYNPPPDPRLRTQAVLQEEMVLLGRPDIVGGTGPISFDEMLELPLIILRQGLSARALLDDASMRKRLEERARLQMNSVSATAGSLLAGIGCAIGTQLFMQEHLAEGSLVARPIVAPELVRTLYICEMTDRPPTFALETVRQLCINLTLDAVASGRWDAKVATM
jgi:LysR family nitrogen assimilation transcriptional regulator